MSYLHDRKIKKKKYFKTALVVLLLLVLFYPGTKVSVWVYFRLVSLAQAVFRPVLALGGKTVGSFGNLGAYFSSKRSLQEENEELEQRLVARDAELSNYDVLARENESLKKILWRIPEENQNKKLVLAAILLKPNQSPYDTLLIDLGAGAGVAAGDIVYAYGNVPVGRIASVASDTSKVVLFSSPGVATEVAVPSSLRGGESGDVFSEVTGRGGGNFEMILPRDFVLEKGDAVVLPGLRPLTLAIAETILSDPRSPWKTALLKSPANIQEIKFVQVEIN